MCIHKYNSMRTKHCTLCMHSGVVFVASFGKFSFIRSHQQTHCTHARFIDFFNWHNWSRTRIIILMYVA